MTFTMFPDTLSSYHIILASKSPRRIEILRNMGLQFEVIGARFAEDLDKSLFPTPDDYVKTNALEKTKEVFQAYFKEPRPRSKVLFIGADTVVVAENKTILEKPASSDHAQRMLQTLRDLKSTQVITGVCLLQFDPAVHPLDAPHIRTFTETTQVTFAEISNDDIARYVATGDPMDKAGAYGYQSLAGCLIQGIHGCYYNVVGLPVHRLFVEIKSLLKEENV